MQQSIKQKIQVVETDLEKRFQDLQQITEHLQNIIQSQDERLKETEAQLAHAGKLAILGTHGASIAHELKDTAYRDQRRNRRNHRCDQCGISGYTPARSFSKKHSETCKQNAYYHRSYL